MEEIVPLYPVHFLSVALDCLYFKGKAGDFLPSRYNLSDLTPLYGISSFAKVALGWSEKGIFVTVEIDQPLRESFFPDFRRGDSVELFIDTRDVKSSCYNTRFCHHFFFLPEEIALNGDRVRAGEITRFRGEERHDLADPASLFVSLEKKWRGARMAIFIPSDSLFGFSPHECDRIGFTYRINQAGGPPQYFSASDEDFSVEVQPSLWASVNLNKEG